MCRDNSNEDPSTDSNSANDEGETGNTDSTESHSSRGKHSTCTLYPINEVKVYGSGKKAVVFMDVGSDSCYITHRAAQRIKAKRLEEYTLNVNTNGGVSTVFNIPISMQLSC